MSAFWRAWIERDLQRPWGSDGQTRINDLPEVTDGRKVSRVIPSDRVRARWSGHDQCGGHPMHPWPHGACEFAGMPAALEARVKQFTDGGWLCDDLEQDVT